MELSIRPYGKNIFPLKGILIKDESPATWLSAIAQMRLELENVKIYLLPGLYANSVWGCVIVSSKELNPHLADKFELCQEVSTSLLIPEKSELHPTVTDAELNKLVHSALHIFHPDFGLAELPEPLQVKSLISEPQMRSYHVTRPEPPVYIPRRIKSFQIKPLSAEELLESMEKKLFPGKEKMLDESLSFPEKAKLFFYKLFLSTDKDKTKGSDERIIRSALFRQAFSLLGLLSKNVTDIEERVVQNYEELERRNQKQIDKLLDLLRTNPEEGLKYAIPIDEHGSTRGGEFYSFNLTRRWMNFSLLTSIGNSNASGTVDLGDSANALRSQYQSTALQLLNSKEYHKAAFIYMKLLKNHILAAQALEQGGYFQEAALIYLKHAQNKAKAAECYEKGRMIDEAITLYKELNQNEKVGDLYTEIGKKAEAHAHYEKVVDAFKQKEQYVKASLVYKNKMDRSDLGQTLLLTGWRENKDALNCLNIYFSGIDDVKMLKNEISTLHRDLGSSSQRNQQFLESIRHQYKSHRELSGWIRDIAYEIISAQAKQNPNILNELKYFNEGDAQLLKDTFRYRLGKKV